MRRAPTAGPPADDPEGAPSAGTPGVLRFALTIGAWFVGLFGLMRIGWVERELLTPFAHLQQRVADQLTGAPSGLVYADASCSGGDPMALCAGAIMAYPAAWGARLRGAALGLAVITGLNVVRLGSLSLVASDRTLLDLLHVYVWPGVLILASTAWVYGWMLRAGRGGSDARLTDRPGAATRRFLLLSAVLVAAWFAVAPFLYASAAVDWAGGWIAVTGGAILTAAGTTAAVSGTMIRTAHGAFAVTQECVVTPLIPLYLAGALAAPLAPSRRLLALAAAPAVFFALGVSRLLVLAVPAAVVGSHAVAIHAFSQVLVAGLLAAGAAVWTAGVGRRGAARALSAIGTGVAAGFVAAPVLSATVGAAAAGLQALAGHAGHTFADDQGAASILPAFQVGLFVALRVAGGRPAWRRAALGLGALALAQAALGAAVGELARHYGFNPHVGLIRGWALAAPLALIWLLGRPVRPSAGAAPAPAAATGYG